MTRRNDFILRRKKRSFRDSRRLQDNSALVFDRRNMRLNSAVSFILGDLLDCLLALLSVDDEVEPKQPKVIIENIYSPLMVA